ncbi:MAG: hypothetical protein HC836_26210 [Richelia sp. RM2_1_2]|nr:hypothetical protein [Richelia sp. RM2_1_2]
MKLIGRKLYLDWGGPNANYVVAIEKLPNMDLNKLGLQITNQVDDDSGFKQAPLMRSLLVNIVDCMGERIEQPVVGTMFPTPKGRSFQDYLTDITCWITQEEANANSKMHDEMFSERKIVAAGKFGDNWTFYINPASNNIDVVNEWIAEHTPSEHISMHKTILYISDKELAFEFKMQFVG